MVEGFLARSERAVTISLLVRILVMGSMLTTPWAKVYTTVVFSIFLLTLLGEETEN